MIKNKNWIARSSMPYDLIRMSGNDKLGKTIIKKSHNNAIQRTAKDAIAELYR